FSTITSFLFALLYYTSGVKHPNASEFEAAGFRVKRGMTINRRFLKKLNEYNSHMLRYLTTPDAAFIGQTPRYRQCVKEISICSPARTAHCAGARNDDARPFPSTAE
ncbi:hypothetical protein, partial [uncultured Cloacibacillus sp.]|uniref:hypothetical protein n=1 Tax=uncultured Cloacibacillus sp. TaxID=889794 RepID=UPI002619C6CE